LWHLSTPFFPSYFEPFEKSHKKEKGPPHPIGPVLALLSKYIYTKEKGASARNKTSYEDKEGATMKSIKMMRRLVGGIVMGMLLFSVAFSQAEEIKFLKVKYMAAQKEMGSAILGSGRLGQLYSQTQESLGTMIRDAGPQGKIDQPLLGKEIAEAAHLKWQAGAAEEALGSAIVKTSMIVSKEAAITGKEAIQERLGAMIQAKAQREWVATEEAKSFVATMAAALQEEQGRTIQKGARFNWAEGEVATAVRTAHLSEKVSEPIPGEVLFSLRSVTGFESEGTLRTALTFMEGEKGVPFTGLLPAPVVITAAGPSKYAEGGWGGFAEFGFFSLLSFGWAMATFSWVMTDLDRGRVKKTEEMEEEEEVVFRKAA
jgi:hypothetical protein